MVSSTTTQISARGSGTYAPVGNALFGGGANKTAEKPVLRPEFQPQLRPGAMQTIYSQQAPAEVRKANAAAMQAKIAAARIALNNSGKLTSMTSSATSGADANRTLGEMWFRQKNKTEMEYVAFDRFVNFGDEADQRI